MGKQLALIEPGEPSQPIARVAPSPAHPDPKPPAAVLQFDLVPIRRRSEREVSEAEHRRRLAEDLAEYLAEHPELRPPVRSKRKRVGTERACREGARPETINAPLTAQERSELLEDVFILTTFGVTLGPPKTLAGCKKTGPCCHVSCRHHNYLEVNPGTGAIKLNFPHIGPEELKDPCSLRVAKRAAKRMAKGPLGEVMGHGEVSARLGITSERTRQLETGALAKIRRARPDLR